MPRGGVRVLGGLRRLGAVRSPLDQVDNIPRIDFMSAICVDSTHAKGLYA